MTSIQDALPQSPSALSETSVPNTTSLYARLKAVLDSRILSGQYPVGGKFPTEHEICEEHKVSRVTARKALKLMEQEGVLVRIRSRGSFVQKLPSTQTEKPTISPTTARSHGPHIPRMVEIRCNMPSPIPSLWQSSWFQQKFKQQFPDVRLVTSSPNNDLPLSKRYNGTDIFGIAPSEYRSLKKMGLLDSWPEVLGDNVWKSLLADIPTDLVRYTGYDKIEYLIPLIYSPVAFIYNKELFDNAGIAHPRFNWSEQEFFATCEALHQQTHARKRFFPFFCDFSSQFRWPFALYREGGRVWSEDGTCCELDSPESLRGIRFYQKMIIDKGWAKPYHGQQAGADYSLFARGHVAIQLGTAFTISKLISEDCQNWGILNVPEGRKRANISTNCLIAVSPHVRDRELISEFIQFIRQPDILSEQFQHWKMFNTSQRAMNEILHESSPEQREFVNAFMRLTPEINNIEYPVSRDATIKLFELIQLLWMDLEHAESHCREISAEINQMIAQTQ